MGQMLFSSSDSIRIRNKSSVLTYHQPLQSEFLNQAFPFFTFIRNENTNMLEPKVEYLPHVQLRMPDGSYVIYKYSVLKERYERKDSSKKANMKFLKIRDLISKVSIEHPKSIYIYGDDLTYELLLDLLVKYWFSRKTTEPELERYIPNVNDKVKINFQGKVTEPLKRVLAKIAFNYFAYCAHKSDELALLYNNKFNLLRSAILNGWPELNSVISVLDSGVDSEVTKTRAIWHQICFQEDADRKVVARLSVLLGFRGYEVILSQSPITTSLEFKFGCGHFFGPDGRISNMVFHRTKSDDIKGLYYGLYYWSI